VVPPVRGFVLDSTMDNLYPVYVDDTTFGRFNTGLDRLFPDGADGDIGRYSMSRWASEHGIPGKSQVTWSSADPLVPVTTLQGIVGLANGGTLIANDTGENGHVFLNGDQTAAREAVSRLLGQ